MFKNKLKNKGLVKYVYNNARLMVDTGTISIENIRRDPFNIFHHIHASDITYVVMQRVNNKKS